MHMTDRREYLREYQRRYLRERREAWITEHGPCAACGSAVRLEIDHIDSASKEINVSQIWSYSQQRRDAELAKCQVLCFSCHRAKTKIDVPHPIIHGMQSGYRRGCRCEKCVQADADYREQYNERRQLSRKAARMVNRLPC